MSKDLTAKQAAFVDGYLEYLNITKAAEMAGYAQPASQGSRMLKNAKVAAAIRERQAIISERALVTAEDVARGLLRIALDELAPAAARVSAWTQLGKYTGGFIERHQVQAEIVSFTLELGRGDDSAELPPRHPPVGEQVRVPLAEEG